MDVNADFSQRVLVRSRSLPWVASPTPGVDRRMLDRLGDEVARATSIVRYAPKSRFPAHIHGGGEEFLVLEGVFSDEHGDYPAGAYVRNPPLSRHTPGSEPGCTILVKLWQFDPADRTEVRLRAPQQVFAPARDRSGVEIAPLFEDAVEQVRLERWSPGTNVALDASGGLEVLVLEGGFVEGGDTLGEGDWLRLPMGSEPQARANPSGCVIWLKSGHLTRLPVPPKH
jgi:anti-sigma factor ChrR (cupin superfamily)